jgi:hypothetical protein
MNSLLAQVYNGGGIPAGVNAASGITGVATANPRTVIINIIATVLDYASLAAFVMVVLAGFYLVLNNGNDENKDKAKKIIYYTLIGLVVLLFSRTIVLIFTKWLPTQV